ncbi:MAG: hypothetical protein WKF75_11895 [Singulisphaera sp.]
MPDDDQGVRDGPPVGVDDAPGERHRPGLAHAERHRLGLARLGGRVRRGRQAATAGRELRDRRARVDALDMEGVVPAARRADDCREAGAPASVIPSSRRSRPLHGMPRLVDDPSDRHAPGRLDRGQLVPLDARRISTSRGDRPGDGM